MMNCIGISDNTSLQTTGSLWYRNIRDLMIEVEGPALSPSGNITNITCYRESDAICPRLHLKDY